MTNSYGSPPDAKPGLYSLPSVDKPPSYQPAASTIRSRAVRGARLARVRSNYVRLPTDAGAPRGGDTRDTALGNGMGSAFSQGGEQQYPGTLTADQLQIPMGQGDYDATTPAPFAVGGTVAADQVNLPFDERRFPNLAFPQPRALGTPMPGSASTMGGIIGSMGPPIRLPGSVVQMPGSVHRYANGGVVRFDGGGDVDANVIEPSVGYDPGFMSDDDKQRFAAAQAAAVANPTASPAKLASMLSGAMQNPIAGNGAPSPATQAPAPQFSWAPNQAPAPIAQPIYQDGPLGTPRAALEQERQGQSQYGNAGLALATALPMVAFGAPSAAASLGIRAAADHYGAPAPVADALSLAPFTSGGPLSRIAEMIGGSAGAEVGRKGDAALPFNDQLPGLGGPLALFGGMAGMQIGGGMARGSGLPDPNIGGQNYGAGLPMGAGDLEDLLKQSIDNAQAEKAAGLKPTGRGDASVADVAGPTLDRQQAERTASAGAARNTFESSLERSGDPGQATRDARMAAAMEAQGQRAGTLGEVDPAEAPLPGAREAGVAPFSSPASAAPESVRSDVTTPVSPTLDDDALRDISKSTGLGLGALRQGDAQALLEDAVQRSQGMRDLYQSGKGMAGNAAENKSQAYGNSMRLNAYQTTLDKYFPESPFSSAKPSGASPDIAAQQAPQAPRTLLPNEVGSAVEAHTPQPAEVQSGRSILGDNVPTISQMMTAGFTKEQAENLFNLATQAKVDAAMQKAGPSPDFGAQRAIANGKPEQMPAGVGGGSVGGRPPGSSGTSGGADRPLPATPKGVDPNAFQQAVAVVRAPARILLTGMHMGRVGVGAAVTHPKEAWEGLKGFGAALRDPEAAAALRSDVKQLPYVGGDGPKGLRAEDFSEKTVPLNKAWVDRQMDKIPGLNRLQDGGSTYLSILRDSIYNTAAEHLERAGITDPKMYRDTYLTVSHATGHSTLPGFKGSPIGNAAQGVGLGPNSLAARFQLLADPFIKSGSPAPWAAGARAEAVRSLMGVGATMLLMDELGKKLGASANMDKVTNPYGLESSLFKVETKTPGGGYKTDYDLSAGYGSLVRLFGNAGIDVANGDKDALEQHVASWMRGQVGPTGSVALDLALGKDWHDDPYGPRGGAAGMKNLNHEMSQAFVDRWAPIASKSMWDSYNAYGGLEGAARGAPGLAAIETSTASLSNRELRNDVLSDPAKLGNAFPDHPGMVAALHGGDASDLTAKEKAALAGAMSPEQLKVMEDHAQELRDKGDPFQKGRDLSDAAHKQVDQLHSDYAGALNLLQDRLLSGKEDPHHVEQLISAVRKDMNAKVDDAYKPSNDYYASPEYKAAVDKLPDATSELQPWLDAYRSLGDRPSVKTPDGYVDAQKLTQLQQAYVERVKQESPALGERLAFNTEKDDSWKPPIMNFYDSIRPIANQYFDQPDGSRTSWARSHPEEEAALIVAGYLPYAHSQAAADYVHQLAPNRNVELRR